MRIIKQSLKIYIYHDRDWFIDWYKNGLYHREDGPATIWSDGVDVYYLKGSRYFIDNYWKRIHENY